MFSSTEESQNLPVQECTDSKSAGWKQKQKTSLPGLSSAGERMNPDLCCWDRTWVGSQGGAGSSELRGQPAHAMEQGHRAGWHEMHGHLHSCWLGQQILAPRVSCRLSTSSPWAMAGSVTLSLHPWHRSGGSPWTQTPTCMLQICQLPHRSVQQHWRGRKNKQRSKQTERQKSKSTSSACTGCWLYLELCLVYVCIQSKFSEEYPAVISQRVWTNSLTAPLLEW